MAEREIVHAGIDDQFTIRAQILAGEMKSLLDFGRQASLDLDRPETTVGQSEQKIDFSAGGRAIEGSLCPGRRGTDQRLDDEALPTRSGDGMSEDGFRVTQTKQGMNGAAVPDINFSAT
jgi:hypothetical protein